MQKKNISKSKIMKINDNTLNELLDNSCSGCKLLVAIL